MGCTPIRGCIGGWDPAGRDPLTPTRPTSVSGHRGGCYASYGAMRVHDGIALCGKTLPKIGSEDYWKITVFAVFNLRRYSRFPPVSNGGFP
jgi:hypothetical protein